MTVTDYLLHLFYLIDTEIKAMNLPRLRRRGPQPRLADSEAITIALAGEFFGIDADKGIYNFFRRYHLAEFPALAQVDRTTFARQAAALWRLTQLLHARVLAMLPLRDPTDDRHWWVIDSFPIRVCRTARAPRAKLFRGAASYGHDPTTPRDLYFGLRAHLRCSDRGPVAQLEVTGANVADLDAAVALSPADPGQPCLGDRNYWYKSAHRLGQLARAAMTLIAPYKKKSSDPDPRRSRLLTRLLTRLRQVIEPVIGQLAVRFHAQRTRARDLWHLTARLSRKVLSHTAAVLLNWRAGNPMLQLDRLLDA